MNDLIVLPDKWCIKITIENKDLLDQFIKDNSFYWKKYDKGWSVRINNFFHYPKFVENAHSSDRIREGYIEITTLDFKKISTKIIDDYEVY